MYFNTDLQIFKFEHVMYEIAFPSHALETCIHIDHHFVLKIALIISVALDFNHHRLFCDFPTNIEMGACDFVN